MCSPLSPHTTPSPHTLLLVPCSLFPVPCSLFPAPCSLLPAPYRIQKYYNYQTLSKDW
ncbi:hypothetical protein BJP36_36205 [Moorena producens JHB]|uniref:Uncharacterized protein n=1 Tax=Moorena producens (strain JHB) TaxID=1454205 RepID=A0A9Q9STU1_MOOP1|nr:hypothetical protein [Moorena producens]WAN69537.1 hypothetical protein BJP36_36205 [Moorena producens JHB]